MRNLAYDGRHEELLVAINDKLNALVESEVGEGVGQMMPDDSDASWILDSAISTLRM